MKTKYLITTAALIAGAAATSILQAQESPTYKADVPKELLTPDKMESSCLGELTFQDGFPTKETASKVSDFVDISRAVELFINGTPTASMYAMLNGHVKIGFKANHTVGITEDLMNARSLWLTPQTTTPYVHVEADVMDDRLSFYYYATGSTPMMVKPMVGKGSVYEIGSSDINGEPLDGGKTYKVTLPAPIPAKDFWSFMVYDNQTRSILETDQVTGGLDSNSKGVKLHDDGSATVYFGPKAPEGQEGNWVQTMPGKGYNVLLRLYGPLEPWFDKTWMPGDFEPVE